MVELSTVLIGLLGLIGFPIMLYFSNRKRD